MKTISPASRSRRFLGRTAASLALIVAGTACCWTAQADTLQNVTTAGVLKIGVFQDYPPFGSVGTDMKPRGFDIDFAEVLGKSLGVRVELMPVTGANRIAYLTDHKLDMLMSVGQTPAREKILDFSVPYAPYYIAVYGPPTLTVKDPAGLAGKRISTAGGTNEDMSLVKVAPPEAVIKRFDDQSGAISAYFAGQVDLISLGGDVARKLRAPNPKVALEEKFKLMNSPMRLAYNKGDTRLKEKLDATISQALKDGTLDSISQKWLGGPLPGSL
jgi:polar amino acid transport system substrate-binding protein